MWLDEVSLVDLVPGCSGSGGAEKSQRFRSIATHTLLEPGA